MSSSLSRVPLFLSLSLSLSPLTMSTPAETPDFCELVYRSNRIIKSHRRHFLALSALFPFPLSLSLVIYPTLQAAISQPNSTLNLNQSQILLPALFSLFVFFLYLCAVGTITYSTIRAFHGTPPQIGSSLKSLLDSFFRLFSTCILSQVTMVMVCLCVAILAKLMWEGFEILGLKIDYEDSKLYVIMIWVGVAVALLVWLQLNWGLALVVVVAEESKWGYEPLRRSAYLMKGMRRVAFSVLTIYWVLVWCLVQWSYLAAAASGGGVWWKIAMLIFGAWSIAVMMLHFVVAKAVLYTYGQALHGDQVEESAGKYVSLPSP